MKFLIYLCKFGEKLIEVIMDHLYVNTQASLKFCGCGIHQQTKTVIHVVTNIEINFNIVCYF